jgi:3-methyladenine DNA glycosylase AlkD
MRGFFKTGVGEYAEGDQFLGIKTGPMRGAAERFRGLGFSELDILLRSCIHEHRMLALMVLGMQYDQADERGRERIHRFYLEHTRCVNNWDLVDDSAAHLVGRHLFDGDVATIRRLAKSEILWERRIAIVATHHFIRRGRFELTLELARELLEDEEDLMHKAVGWMLREVGKRDVKVLQGFLRKYVARMPRTALRYAIERFPPSHRREYLKVPRVKSRISKAGGKSLKSRRDAI